MAWGVGVFDLPERVIGVVESLDPGGGGGDSSEVGAAGAGDGDFRECWEGSEEERSGAVLFEGGVSEGWGDEGRAGGVADASHGDARGEPGAGGGERAAFASLKNRD